MKRSMLSSKINFIIHQMITPNDKEYVISQPPNDNINGVICQMAHIIYISPIIIPIKKEKVIIQPDDNIYAIIQLSSLSVQSRSTCPGWHVPAALSWLSCPCCTVLAVLPQLSCPRRPLQPCPAEMILPSSPLCPLQADMIWLTYHANLSRVTCPGCPAHAILSRLSCSGCPVSSNIKVGYPWNFCS